MAAIIKKITNCLHCPCLCVIIQDDRDPIESPKFYGCNLRIMEKLYKQQGNLFRTCPLKKANITLELS